VFGIWNGWTLTVMAANRTAVLPGGTTRVVLDRGPFRLSRNPLYVGLIVLDVAIALLWPSGVGADRSPGRRGIAVLGRDCPRGAISQHQVRR